VNDSLDLAPGVVVPALRKLKVRDAYRILIILHIKGLQLNN
jgi:hypothetical protein